MYFLLPRILTPGASHGHLGQREPPCDGGPPTARPEVAHALRKLQQGLLTLLVGAIAFGSALPAVVATEQGAPALARRIESSHLPNLLQIHQRVYSGGLPEGREAFAELQRRGVRTLISVDGAHPDVTLAGEFGLRYVHLPHGYDGIPAERRQQLARAIHSLPSPIYVHCHHGKHRSPAAAAAGCVGAGLLSPEAVTQVLALAGTHTGYTGLFRDARASQPLAAKDLEALPDEFVPVAELPAMTEAMVAIEHRFDLVQRKLRELPVSPPSETSSPGGAPQEAEHESLLLWEHYRELARMDDPRVHEPSFAIWLRDGELLAAQLHEAVQNIAAGERHASRLKATVDELPLRLRRMESNCQACHRQYRDSPRAP